MVNAIVILAGGGGRRLWPSSTVARPKQFMDLGDGISLLKRTLLRAQELAPSVPIYIISHHSQIELILQDARALDKGILDRITLVPEPAMCNTAAAIFLAGSLIHREQSADATMLVLPSDQLISPVELFRQAVEHADALAREGLLLTMGIQPRSAETGFGYIHRGPPVGNGWHVESFTEKPDSRTAKQYVDSGEYFWNSGMFIFRIRDMFLEGKKYAQDLVEEFESCASISQLYSRAQNSGVTIIEWLDTNMDEIYGRVSEKISIDYALMEKSKKVAMVVFNGRWSDVGSWDEIMRLTEENYFPIEQDNDGVYKSHSTFVASIDSHANYVYSKDMQVALCGVENIGVVVDNGKVLIFQRGSTQSVKDLYDCFEGG